MKYNLHDVMSKAWEIYHANKQPDGLRPVFSICLEMAWEHAKNANVLNRKFTTCSITRLWPGCCPIM